MRESRRRGSFFWTIHKEHLMKTVEIVLKHLVPALGAIKIEMGEGGTA
jgi:hypothetical protein